MDIEVKKGDDISEEEFPLFSETLEYFDLIMDVDDFGVTYFGEHVGRDSDYAVIRTEDFRELDDGSREHLRGRIQDKGLDGNQSPDELTAFIRSLRLDTVDRVVADIAELHSRGLSAGERAEINSQVRDVADDFHDGAAEGLGGLLDNPNVGRVLDSESPFLQLPEVDDEILKRIRDTKMPAYFVIDVSFSMAFESRIDHANAFVRSTSEHLKQERVSDDVQCLIYWGEHRFIDLTDPRRFEVGEATDTGAALGVVGAEIRACNHDSPVFLALVTDGVPNCPGSHDGVEYDPVDYTVHMASLLPDNVIFTQIAFAPVDPGDPAHPETLEGFRHYLADLKRVTDVVANAQTYVLVRESEQHLPWLPLAALQKAKHLSLLGQGFAVIGDE
jgi:hypothetical protein